MSRQVNVDSKAYQVNYETSGDWTTSFNGQINIQNISEDTIEDWIMEFDFPYEIERFWTAQIVSKTENHYVIKNAGYNANIKVGETLNLGFDGKPGDVNCNPTNFVIHQVKVDLSNLNIDSDQDSLSDFTELKLGTDRNDNDTDKDGLADGYEYNVLKTDLLKVDSDSNGVSDGDEDFDHDLLTNKEEFQNGTDPCLEDTDGDTFTDYYEVNNGMNPLVFDEKPSDDEDDNDFDKLTNKEERELGTDPYYVDTDSDGFSDYYEVKHGMSPFISDEVHVSSMQTAMVHDNSLMDLQALNAEEYYPLDISYNDEETQIT